MEDQDSTQVQPLDLNNTDQGYIPQQDVAASTQQHLLSLDPSQNSNSAGTSVPIQPTQAPSVSGFKANTLAQQNSSNEAAQLRAHTEKDTWGNLGGAIWRESLTKSILDAIPYGDDEDRHNPANDDPTWDAVASYHEVIKELGIQDNDAAQKWLGESYDHESMVQRAHLYQQHQQDLQVLNDHPLYSLAGQMTDPANLLLDAVTFGTARLIKLGKLGKALATGGLVGAEQGAIAAGLDYTQDHEVSGAHVLVAAGLGSIVGGFIGAGGLRGLSSATGNPVPNISPTGIAGKTTQFVNNITSEYAQLTRTPELQKLVAPVLEDPRNMGYYSGTTAASNLRRLKVQADKTANAFYSAIDEAVAARGVQAPAWAPLTSKLTGAPASRMATKQTMEVREQVMNDFDDFMQYRNQMWRDQGIVVDATDPAIQKLVSSWETHIKWVLDQAKQMGLKGADTTEATVGYVPRTWVSEAFVKAKNTLDDIGLKGTDELRQLFVRSLQSGRSKYPISDEDAQDIADAVIRRQVSRANGQAGNLRNEFGSYDLGNVRQMLTDAGVKEHRIESIMRNFEAKREDTAQTRYMKERLPFDMTMTHTMSNGETISMRDFIDHGSEKILDNYTTQMLGRSALAEKGIDNPEAWMDSVREAALKTMDLSDANKVRDRLSYAIGEDFTGFRPKEVTPSDWQRELTRFSGVTMLSFSGLWQAAETATIAAQYGARRTVQEMFKRAPVMKQLMRQISKDKDAYEQLNDVFNMDLSKDVQFMPNMRQVEIGIRTKAGAWDNLMHNAKQLIPYVNGMKFVHSAQARLITNLAVSDLKRAARGNKGSLKNVLANNQGNEWKLAEYALKHYASGDQLNLGTWPKKYQDAFNNLWLRMADRGVTFARSGEGNSFSRTPVGKLLLQFQNFVAYAHNKQLRFTLAHHGALGVAQMLAYQYPATYLAVMAKDMVNGTYDPNKEGMYKQMALEGLGYTAGLGFFGTALGTLGLTGGQAGYNIPVAGVIGSASGLVGGAKQIVAGDTQKGVNTGLKTLINSTPILGATLGHQLLTNTWDTK